MQPTLNLKILHVCHNVDKLLEMEKYRFGVGPKGITLIESLMKNCQVVQRPQMRVLSPTRKETS